jgi:hypothetical protein
MFRPEITIMKCLKFCCFKESVILLLVCPLCSYVYLYCAVSVIGLVAVDSAHK